MDYLSEKLIEMFEAAISGGYYEFKVNDYTFNTENLITIIDLLKKANIEILTYAEWASRSSGPSGEDYLSLVSIINRMAAEVIEMKRKLSLLVGTCAADDQRLLDASIKVGIPYFGCDTPDALADEIMKLRDEINRLKSGKEKDDNETKQD